MDNELTDFEAGMVEVLLTQYLLRNGEKMRQEIPIPYIVLRSAQSKLRARSNRKQQGQ